MVKLDWQYTTPGIGALLGYSVYQKKLRAALEAGGVVIDKDAAIAMHVCPPYFFTLKRFRRNMLTTFFEYDRIPSQWNHILDKAELVIVPCSQNERIFSAATTRPVEVCPVGVDSESYPYVKRAMSDPFVFLYLGDDNPRKGTRHIAQAWELWNERYPDIAKKTQLIMKMTSYLKEQKLVQMTENSYADYRLLPVHETEDSDWPTLGALYAHANAFLFPSMGEGWGMPLAEAMSTGLPCIYTPFGGPEDFAHPEYAYPIEYNWREIRICAAGIGNLDPLQAADPVVDSIVERMHEIYTDYDTALDKGKTAAAAMRAWFTWEQAAKKYIEILQRYI